MYKRQRQEHGDQFVKGYDSRNFVKFLSLLIREKIPRVRVSVRVGDTVERRNYIILIYMSSKYTKHCLPCNR